MNCFGLKGEINLGLSFGHLVPEKDRMSYNDERGCSYYFFIGN